MSEEKRAQQIWFSIHGCMIHANRWQYSLSHTLVLIHGAIANSAWWQHIGAQLSNGQILSIDLSGHGLSGWDEPYTLQKHAQEVQVLIDEYAKGPVYIVGHSYGGAVAAMVAANMHIRHAVMLDTPLYIALDQQTPSEKSYQKYIYSSIDEAVSRFKPIPNQPILNKQLLRSVAMQSIKETDGGYTWQFDPAFHKRDIGKEGQSQILTILDKMSYWYGEHSPFATEHTLERARAAGMITAMIPNAYHAVMLDNPDALISMINDMTASAESCS